MGITDDKSLLTDKEKLVLQLYIGGKSFKAIGDMLGVSANQASIYYHTALDYENIRRNCPFKNLIFQNVESRHLGVQIIKALMFNGITDIDSLARLTTEDLKKMRFIGDKSIKALGVILSQVSDM